MIRDDIAAAIQQAVSSTYDLKLDSVELKPAESGYGDYASNVAFTLASQLGRAPREIAAELVGAVKDASVATVEVGGAGYLNLTLTDAAVVSLAEASSKPRLDQYQGQVVVTEYSDPNPFKVLHVGHLYTTVIGDTISNLIRAAGGTVHPVNFGGDVGLHVAKTMWAIIDTLGGELPEKLAAIGADERSVWLAGRYVEGTAAYDDDEAAKAKIIELNRAIYEFHADDEHESSLAQIYWTCRQWSYDYFDRFYARIGSKFEKYYPESQTAPIGLATVREQQAKGVYTESDGAVVFSGEVYGLHTRVFITSQGLPTYETKDVGVLMAKWRDYQFDRSIVITGNDIIEYMKVVLKSVEQFEPELAHHTTHITHGNVKLAGGTKMSSRKGNFLQAVEVLDITAEANQAANGQQDPEVVLGAIKYAFVKQRIGSDLVFVPEESVSLEGNSGPYLQYAHARARSILAKGSEAANLSQIAELTLAERSLAIKVGEYGDVMNRAVDELLPHYIATYLYELAQTFNRFYEGSRVIGDDREGIRLWLVTRYADVLRDGLAILGITAPDKL